MIRSKKLKKLKEISHGFFNRNGGKSKGIYKSLNCGLGSNDKKINIQKNLKIAKNKISKNSKNILLVNQTHSQKYIYINNSNKIKSKRVKADAIITNQKKLPIAILTADCVPILIYDDTLKIIAAIHAGWRGAYKGIINNVIKFMIKKGSKIENIHAAIGPSISQKNYNVKKDFLKKFLKKTKKIKYFLKKEKI